MGNAETRLTRDLTIRYVAVLAIIGGLAIASFLGLVRILMDAEAGGAVIGVAAQQRPLVERVVFAVANLTRPLEPQARLDERAALALALDRLESAHFGLVAGMPEVKGAAPPSAAIKALLFGPDGRLDHEMRGFVGQARAVLAKADQRLPADDTDAKALSPSRVEPLLVLLDRLVTRYREENDKRLRRLFLFHGAALAATLALLILSAAMVFRPMVSRIKDDLAERVKAARKLKESEERLWRILEESPVGVSVSRRSDGAVVFANSRFVDIINTTRDDLIGHPARDLFRNESQRKAVVEALKRDGHIDDAEVQFIRRGGETFWSLLTLRSTFFEEEPVNLAWVYDISAIKAAQAKVRLTAQVVESASEAVVITNAANIIEYVNPAFTTITGYESAEVIGRDPGFLSSGRHDADFYQTMWDDLRATGRWRGEIWNRRKSGEFYAEQLSIVALMSDDGQAVTHYIAIFSDITNRKEDEERIWRQANYDALTGLPNRSLFTDRLQQAVRQSQRDGSRFALMFLDLDGFKAVNDTLGHAAGDELLQQAAKRLEDCVRASDTVSRLAGDEFTCIIPGVHGKADVERVAAKILEELAQPFELEAGRADVRGSIGIAIFPDDADTGPALVGRADEAMYAVKKSGKNAFRFA
ncbi:putative diguanylate cyclase with PAS/PAC sensor [Magnetospirillum sp. LM-5]|uniref:diguanylate cyclase domain-containing protein n=1 Tax=Magnetospirillum sp. LM-5 TaxID=2681466 RepID=UPI00137C939D|nr:diguanylate cyclase [Magnetospirillum sp. LM-5]CAA7613872.1 putative diguanylate cyclase with PAS/PAC sensor [Magnetospirillum sp. LM-5]